ncbi:uncharacterized protein LOC115151088 isoform X1 [Salmo trutta]|uniref:uncharacterized protein LOC115151088 isoform X1 n=1 Tax=Salmo trutta TaxID=8032 RepID=UPI0011320EF0|nr:uncharacterized protein LOC115151088 isoform X1 [Salmo trutta]
MLEDQVFMALMKLCHSYANLHLAQLFRCSASTVSNVTITLIHVIHKLSFITIMKIVLSRKKNQTCLPASFQGSSRNCMMIMDCNDIEVATPSLQKKTYCSMHSFKLLLGVAPNAVITYCSDLYQGSLSYKAIVQKLGFEVISTSGDMMLAYKGLLFQSLMPAGVTVNILPFLKHRMFTESEIHPMKDIARNKIHVERVNARLKDEKKN